MDRTRLMSLTISSDDLTAAMGTVVATHPTMTNTEWITWSDGLDVTHRYPGSLGLAYVGR